WSCDTCYWAASSFGAWAARGVSHPRLWVFSTGGTTAKNGAAILNLTKPKPAPKPKVAAKARGPGANALSGAAVGSAVGAIRTGFNVLTDGTMLNTLATKIEVLIEHDPYNRGQPSYTDGAWAAYGGGAG